MKRLVFVNNAAELQERLWMGKRVEGALYVDPATGCLTFKAYNRHRGVCRHERLVRKLPWGWVKESLERFRVYASVPKRLSAGELLAALDEHLRQAEATLMGRVIDEALD